MLKNIINIFSISVLQKLFVGLIQVLNQKGDYFITYQERPKTAKDIHFSNLGLSYEDVAIVLQGPIIEEENFTLETVKLYVKNFPLVRVIVSTWVNSSIAAIKQLENIGAIVLLNEKPANGGPLNINYQIVSTLQGLKKVKELNKQFVVKSRADQRFYNPFFLQAFLLIRQNTFYTSNEFGLKGKLIVSSMSTLKYRPYGITDMLMMGYTDDLLAYWPSEVDTRVVEVKPYLNVLEYAKLELAETYLLTQFIKRKQIPIEFTLQQTWQLYSKLFIVLDKANFDIFWFKYSIEKENRLAFDADHVYKELSFFEWLSLNNVEQFPEEFLQRAIPPYIP